MKKSIKYKIISTLALLLVFSIPAYSFFGNEEVDIIHIKVKEISNTEGVVSTENKKFRLIVDHDPNYIGSQNDSLFNSNSSPLIKNLLIIKRDLNRENNNAKNITEEFEFDQEDDSFESPEYDNFLRTTFISNNQIIKKAQRLSFKIDLYDYLRTLQISIPENLNTKDTFKLDIKALEITFSSLSLENKSLVFSPINASKAKTFYTTDNLNILGTFHSNGNLSDVVKQFQFDTLSDSGKPIVAKLKQEGTKKDLKLKPLVNNGDISITTNGNGIYNMVLPAALRTQDKLNATSIAAISNYDLLILPVILDLKTGDNLDINISGTLREGVNTSVNAIFE